MPQPSIVRVSGQGPEYTSGTVLSDITGLAFAVVSGSTYRFKASILWSSDGAPNFGFTLSLSCPAFTRLAACVKGPTGAVDGTGEDVMGWIRASNEEVDLGGSIGVGLTNFSMITGIIRPSADGIVQIRYCSEVDTNPCRYLDGSMLEYEVIA